MFSSVQVFFFALTFSFVKYSFYFSLKIQNLPILNFTRGIHGYWGQIIQYWRHIVHWHIIYYCELSRCRSRYEGEFLNFLGEILNNQILTNIKYALCAKARFNLHQNQIVGDKLHFQSFSFESVHKSHNILDTLSRLRAQLGIVPSVSTKPVLSENTIDKKAAIKLPRPSLVLALPRLAPGETQPGPNTICIINWKKYSVEFAINPTSFDQPSPWINSVYFPKRNCRTLNIYFVLNFVNDTNLNIYIVLLISSLLHELLPS